MARVKALREHSNEFGPKYRKAEGDEYEVADAATVKTLEKAGLVEAVDDSKSRGSSGPGQSTK